MANWGTTTYTVGVLADEYKGWATHSFTKLLSDFDFVAADDTPAFVSSLDVNELTVSVTLDGQWGCTIPLTEESFNKLSQHVLIIDEYNGDCDYSRTIYIGGEKVFSELDESGYGFIRGFPDYYEPRNTQEQGFFDALQKLEVELIAKRFKESCIEDASRKNPELAVSIDAYIEKCTEESKQIEAEMIAEMEAM